MGDLAERLGSGWRQQLADPDGRGIWVGFLSQLAMGQAEQVAAFPEQLEPIQVDSGQTLREMGRPALRVRVEAAGQTLDLVTCHLKSKLLTFPGGRCTPKDKDERARYAVFALHRRAGLKREPN